MNRTLLALVSVLIAGSTVACGLTDSGVPVPSFASSPPGYTVEPAAVAAAPTAVVPATGICHSTDGRADRACTPGVTNPQVTQANIAQTLCHKGWTATVRPPATYTNSLKTRQMRDYGQTGSAPAYEEDHLIPLELGGNPSDAHNLWPEPRSGSRPASTKDQEENQLHKAVCNLRMTLSQAQAKILADWRS